jgi:hypothetical protein
MMLNIHLDALYLSEPNARSRACNHFFMGSLTTDGKPIKLNGAFHTLCSILQFVVASAAEAELGALFLNCQEGMIFKSTIEDLCHPQPKIPLQQQCNCHWHSKYHHQTAKIASDGNEIFLDM